MNSCVLLIMTDGRDELLDRTIASATENLKGPISRRVIHTDNGLEHLVQTHIRHPDWEVIGGERLGFGGAINRAWQYIAQMDESFCMHLEDDFLFNKPVPVKGMMKILGLFTYLSQIVLCRQPWNEPERKAGGIVEMWPDEYTEMEWEGYHWLEHRLHWSTNPCLYRTDLCREGWPTHEHSERTFSDLILSDINVKSSYWGTRADHVWVEHIGIERAGHTY